ncbi:MAG: adenylate/guanylate cyclase domain-containing protein [Bacteroidales bacterium]
MKSKQAIQLRSALRSGLISAVITAIFMYVIYFPGWQSIAAGLCIGFSIPLSLGFYYTYVMRKYLSRGNLLVLLSINTLVHVLVIFVIAIVFVVIFYMKGNINQILNNRHFWFSNEFLVGIGFGLVMSLVFNFFYILNTLIGRHILAKFFIGMYRHPREVERIFMFLDLKSSTSIAEKIGHLKFLSLVNDFFYDIAEPVRLTKGEIYKYVGDEAIISWKMKDGISEANCVRCFLMIIEIIQKKSTYYNEKYGIVPTFKAGLHGGLSVTGELGYTKREIAFMGDVLNTTARIEEACKTFDKQLLISDDLVKKLTVYENIKYREVGNVKLRGKEQKCRFRRIKKPFV